MNHSDFWTDHRVSTLKVLWANGMTTQYIAAQIGSTKNAVVGKISRLDLPTRSGDGRSISPRKPSNANPRSPTMGLEERTLWVKSINERLKQHGVTSVRLALISGVSDAHLCRLKRNPERYACTEDFKRRVEEGLAVIIGRKMRLP